jgi:hypothetical protein
VAEGREHSYHQALDADGDGFVTFGDLLLSFSLVKRAQLRYGIASILHFAHVCLLIPQQV